MSKFMEETQLGCTSPSAGIDPPWENYDEVTYRDGLLVDENRLDHDPMRGL